jgi:hypothetical protein
VKSQIAQGLNRKLSKNVNLPNLDKHKQKLLNTLERKEKLDFKQKKHL